jgi:protein-L-isoaspartate O-methyltransferase
MNIKPFAAALQMPNLLVKLQLNQDHKGFLRLHYLHAAIDSGLLQALATPASREELLDQLRVKRPELLDALLELGLALKELSLKRGLYHLVGRRSLALVSEEGLMLGALVQELVLYHGSVYTNLAGRIQGAPLGNYLETMGVMIARSSRIFEPFIKSFTQSIVEEEQPASLLEVGCGSGVYLRHAAQINPQLKGIGIDLSKEVVEEALRNLERWGLLDNFEVVLADIRNPPDKINGPFDLITLYQNIYYFVPSERPALFQSLISRLAPGGVLAIVSIMRATSPAAVDFELVLRSTVGCTELPELQETKSQLEECGFRQVRTIRLIPGESFYGITAKRAR